MRGPKWMICFSLLCMGALFQSANLSAFEMSLSVDAADIYLPPDASGGPFFAIGAGVDITGTYPGTTPYSAHAVFSAIPVTLTAPASVRGQDGKTYVFRRWNISSYDLFPDGQNTVDFVWDNNMSATAQYTQAVGTVRTLTVNSGPIPVDSGVDVIGTNPGTTPYSAVTADGAVVTLNARTPIIGPEPGNVTYWFDHWIVAGKAQEVGASTTTFTMTKDITATAIYTSIKLWELDVSSSPVAGIPISGTANGTTNYTAGVQNDTQVAVTAPSSFSVRGVSYTFRNWNLNGAPQTEGVADLAFQMEENVSLEAVYLITDRKLNVQSSPISNVTISGSAGGSTNYSAVVPDHTLVTLTAPASVVSGSDTYAFKGWSGLASMKETALTQYLYITTDTTLTATYGKIALAVTYPKETGIILERGSRAAISWNSDNLPKGSRVKVRLVKGGAAAWTLSATATKSPLQWTVGAPIAGADPIPDGTDFTIRVSALDDTVLAESENPFSIGSVASLAIDGPTRVQGGSAPTQYHCIAHYNVGGELDVTPLVKWSCLPSTYAKMGKTGLLATKPALSDQPFQLTAAYGKGKPPVTGTLDVTVTP